MQEIKSIMEELQKPFSEEEIEWRVGSTNKDKTKGLALAYLTSRSIQIRLDEVLGANCWQTEYREINNGYICRLSIKINDTWIFKEDGSGLTDFEGIKGGLSSAFKRVAASGYGIGRYLYFLPKKWVDIEPKGNSYIIKDTSKTNSPTSSKILPKAPNSTSDKITSKQIYLILNKATDLDWLKFILESEYNVELSSKEKGEVILKAKQMNPEQAMRLAIEYRLNHLNKTEASKLIKSIIEVA